MRDLQAVAKECLMELDEIGIEYGLITRFVVNTRAKKRWGQCKKAGARWDVVAGVVRDTYEINISYVLLDERNPIEALKNTLIHEVLHTCKGCMNHGEAWKKLADKVNRAYGYGIKRCSSADEKGVEYDNRDKQPRKIKHQFKCEHCGQLINRQRESDFTKHYKSYKCGRCGGAFIKLF